MQRQPLQKHYLKINYDQYLNAENNYHLPNRGFILFKTRLRSHYR